MEFTLLANKKGEVYVKTQFVAKVNLNLRQAKVIKMKLSPLCNLSGSTMMLAKALFFSR